MKHFGHMPNIQLLYVAAILEQQGVDVLYYDMVGMEMSEDEVVAGLQAFAPDIVCMSVFTSHFHNAQAWARLVKSKLPQADIMLGGVHAEIYPTETIRYIPCTDYVCVGEAEVVLPEFVERWQGNQGFEGMKGIVWKDEEGNAHFVGPADKCQELDSVPFPARHLVPNERYFNFISTARNYTVFNTSRGCPFRCIFCEAPYRDGRRWRSRSAKNVVDEFEHCYEEHGIREVDIFDSSFTVNRQRVLDICQGLINRGLHRKVIWDVRSRVDTIDEEMLDALKEAGCYRIFYGIESANRTILRALRKDIEIDRIEKVVRKTDDVGISAFGYFLIGSPGETDETARETIEFAKRLPLDFAIFNSLTAFPKTELYEEFYLPHEKRDFWAEYIEKAESESSFMGRPWTEMSDAEIRRLAHKAMNEYSCRPCPLSRAVRSIRSYDQFSRYVHAGWDMLVSYILGR